MVPGKYNIPNQYQGDSFERIDIAFFNGTPDPGNEMNLTGVVPKMQIRLEREDGRLVKTLIVGDGIEWTDEANGELYINPFLITFSYGDYWYDLQLTYPSGEVKTYLRGKIKVVNDVTR